MITLTRKTNASNNNVEYRTLWTRGMLGPAHFCAAIALMNIISPMIT